MPLSRQEIAPSLLGEIVRIGYDYTGLLPEGATIASAAITVELYSGDDDSPNTLATGGPSIEGDFVYQRFTPLIEGNIYLTTCLATLSDGLISARQAFLSIVPPPT